MICDENMGITDFEEKPAKPRSTLASMGIYIFSWKKLRQYLIDNENNPEEDKDFGKAIIPNMLNAGEKLVAYPFEGYWRDVGTIDSLWEANMDLLNPNIPLDLYDPDWKIYSRTANMPPQYVGSSAKIENSMISEGAVVNGNVDFSIIFPGVTIEEGATVRDSIIMPGSVIKAGAVVEYAIVGEECVVGEYATIGARPESVTDKDSWGVAVIGHNLTVSEGKKIAPKENVTENV